MPWCPPMNSLASKCPVQRVGDDPGTTILQPHLRRGDGDPKSTALPHGHAGMKCLNISELVACDYRFELEKFLCPTATSLLPYRHR
jgi:hypothetical protein